jgi:hypothetical protein
MSHTPGPWRIAETIGDNIRTPKQVAIRPVDDRHAEHGAVCCLVWGADTPECKTNAKLIASAPEMLDMLLRIDASLDSGDDDPIWLDMREVIKKARGQL